MMRRSRAKTGRTSDARGLRGLWQPGHCLNLSSLRNRLLQALHHSRAPISSPDLTVRSVPRYSLAQDGSAATSIPGRLPPLLNPPPPAGCRSPRHCGAASRAAPPSTRVVVGLPVGGRERWGRPRRCRNWCSRGDRRSRSGSGCRGSRSPDPANLSCG